MAFSKRKGLSLPLGAKLVRLKEGLAADMARKRAELRKEKSQLMDLDNEVGFEEEELTGNCGQLVLGAFKYLNLRLISMLSETEFHCGNFGMNVWCADQTDTDEDDMVDEEDEEMEDEEEEEVDDEAEYANNDNGATEEVRNTLVCGLECSKRRANSLIFSQEFEQNKTELL